MTTWILLGLLASAAGEPFTTLPTAGTNLAFGKVVQFDPAPNYSQCDDDDDIRQLCDGIYNGCRWADKGTVGWIKRDRVKLIDIDLGAAYPIDKVTFDTVTGLASQVTFPAAVLVFASTNGEQYRYLGDVLTESLPQERGMLNHRFVLGQLKGWGRYVRLAIISGGFYVFCDEIEILQGKHTEIEATFLDPDPIPAEAVRAYAMERISWSTQKNATLTLLREAKTAIAARAALLKDDPTIAAAQKIIEHGRKHVMIDPTVTSANYGQGPPYRTLDWQAFAAVGNINAALWPGQSAVVWQDNDWNWLHPLDSPLGMETGANVHVDMMQNEWATASFVITSTSDRSQPLSISADVFQGPTAVTSGPVLKISHVVHSEAFGFNYRDDVIVPIDEEPVVLRPGVAKRIWLTFKTRDKNIVPGTYTSTIKVLSGKATIARVPVALRVWPFRFPDNVSLHSNTWGYFDQIALQEREKSAAQNLADHYNTTFTLHHSWIPYPKPDSAGNFTQPLDFTRMDQMLEWCPDVRLWLIWPGFEWGFCRLGTEEYGSPVWEKVFTQWVTQIRDHLGEKGITKDRFAWYWIDESNEGEEWEKLCLRPSKLIKTIDPEMQVWTNPQVKTSQGVREIEEGLPYCDMYCPVFGSIARNPKVLEICHRTRRKSWTYVCSSEKNRNPFAYYRWFAWNAWKLNLGGIGMWVYVDDNNMTFSDYTDGVSYGMVYRGDHGILDSKRWDAWRQGIADYEYLRMLRDAVDTAKRAGTDPERYLKAERILSQDVDRVVGKEQQGDPALSALPDQLRVQILKCLIALRDV